MIWTPLSIILTVAACAIIVIPLAAFFSTVVIDIISKKLMFLIGAVIGVMKPDIRDQVMKESREKQPK